MSGKLGNLRREGFDGYLEKPISMRELCWRRLKMREDS
jgi:DNA-binding response OmpR family regulator